MGEADGSRPKAAWEEVIERYEIVVPLLLEEGPNRGEWEGTPLAPYREVIRDREAILRKLGEPQSQAGPVAVQGRHNP